MRLFSMAPDMRFVFDGVVRSRERGENVADGDDKRSHRGKPVTRWNVQPLRELEADVFPTPPTESLRQTKPAEGRKQKTERRRPPRPSKS